MNSKINLIYISYIIQKHFDIIKNAIICLNKKIQSIRLYYIQMNFIP